MIGLYSEKRTLKDTTSLSFDLASHIFGRRVNGKVAVVTDQPAALLSATRKQWLRLIRLRQRELSSTLSPQRKLEIAHDLECLRGTTFTSQPPVTDPQADISFATVEQFLQAPPICKTLYITDGVERHEQYMLVSWMPPSGLVVIYGR